MWLACSALGLLMLAPWAVGVRSGIGPGAAVVLGLGGLGSAVDSVGWVLVPQLLLAVAIGGLALERASVSAVGLPQRPDPSWLSAAVESALLLGMLGTISGMVRGFMGISPDELQPGPLVHALGTALRSSFVGFGIALVGVWVRSEDAVAAPAGAAARPSA